MSTKIQRRSSKAQAIAEFALSLPILLLIVAITIDFGRVYFFDLSIRDASFAAARYAGMNPFDDPGIKSAAVNASNGVLTTTNVAITAPVVTGCTGTRVSGCPMKISVSYVFAPITPFISSLIGSSITLSRSQTDIVK